MADSAPRSLGSLAIFGIAVLMNLLLTVLLLSQIRETRSEVRQLRDELATKQDLAMMRPIRVREILEERCTTCHTDRRFAATRGMSDAEILATIHRMESHPGANIPADQVEEIKAALLVFRCTSCHGEDVLSRIILMPRDERTRFLRGKVALPGSGFRPDQLGELIAAFRVLESR